MAFPVPPPPLVNGQEHVEGSMLYRWDASLPGWRLIGPAPTPSVGASYEHDQTTAATVWTIPHNLNFRYVDHLVVDDVGNTVWCDVDWSNSTANAVRLVFCNAKEGTAVIRR